MTHSNTVVRAVLVIVFGLVFSLRWLTVTGLGSDDHFALWSASVFLHGDRPLRDFADLGVPLYWAVSAAMQALVGYRPVGEVLLGTTLVAAGITLSFRMAWLASRSLFIASALTVIATLLVTTTKLYSYPKLFLYPLGAWLCWRYIDRPTFARLAALAVGVAIAFGYRHDHGAYIGLGAAAAMFVAHWNHGADWSERARRIVQVGVRFGVMLLVLISPFLIYVQANVGVIPYFHDRIATARHLDAGNRQDVWFDPLTPGPSQWFFMAPPPSARVHVDWRPDVSPDVRMTLEKRYSLTSPLAPKQQLYEYELTDASPATLTALIADPKTAEVKDIPAVIVIEWHASADAERRREFQERYHLRNPRPNPDDASGASLVYDIVDVSKANLLELDSDAHLRRREAPRAATAAPSSEGASAPVVRIQWRMDLGDAERAGLEQQYGLEDATPGRNRWEYELTDVSRANVQRLVEDAHVYDTGLIHRDTYRPMEETWWTIAQRGIAPLRLRISPELLSIHNAGVWLYYVSYALPLLVLAALAVVLLRGASLAALPRETTMVLVVAAMMAVANLALLRRLGYFSDHVGMATLFGAFVLGRIFTAPRRHTVVGALSAVAAVVLLAVTVVSTVTYASPIGVVRTIRLDNGVTGAWDRGVQLFRSYSVSPPIDEYAPPNSVGGRAVIRYIYECTRPDDRIWLLSDLHTFPYYTERRVIGHPYWDKGFLNTPEYQQKILERIDDESVPLVVQLGGRRPLAYLEPYAQVHEYAVRRFSQHYTTADDSGAVFWISTDSRRQPTGTYERLGLPCFR